MPPGSPQRRPAAGGLVALRVLFCALALLSCGFLGWVPLLRLAIVTRKALDWVLFVLALLGSAALFTYIGVFAEEEGSDLEAFLGLGAILILAAGPVTYYLVAEIRHFERFKSPPPPYLPPLGYAYATAVTTPSGAAPRNPYTAEPPAVPAPPPPRIEQVRAELDELSDLLRRRDDDGRA
nr:MULTISPECIES: hypothetical protein [unclassified Streptomyces]